MTHELSLQETQKEWHGTLRSYVMGFTSCVALTLISFTLVAAHILTGHILVITLVSLALVQAIIQLLFFLHLGQEAAPRWETLVFYFMVMVLLIVVLGTLWIIFDLNERTMHDIPMMMSHD